MEWQERREGLGLSQAALAEAAGITRTALSLIENGRLRPSFRTRQALERSLDPLSNPIRLVHGGGPVSAADLLRRIGEDEDAPYALTLDVAAWLLTRYQTPAAAWAYVRPLETWVSALRRRGVRPAARGARADLLLLRAPNDVLREAHPVEGYVLVSPRRLLEDCARLGGRHGLDAARVYAGFPEARSPGVRLDADALRKVFEEGVPWM